MTALLVALAVTVTVLCFVLAAVYALRVLLRVVALRAAVAFYQAPGTSGSSIGLAREMFHFLASGTAPR